MVQYIAYYRVSTDRQGKSGLGLDAQRTAVVSFIAGRGELVAEFTEVESGRRSDRPQLAEALALCRRKKARLIIATLDRLARNVAFIANLIESGVEFVACDMPEASRLTLHILAAVAEHEREMISKRTKDALQQAKARGMKLGNPTPTLSLERGRAVIADRLARHREKVRPTVLELYDQGLGLRAIARELNLRGIKTARGRQWQAVTVRNVLQHAEIVTDE